MPTIGKTTKNRILLHVFKNGEMLMKNWYWWRLNRIYGPFDEKDLVELEKKAKLHLHSKLRYGHSHDWVEYKNVRNEVHKIYSKSIRTRIAQPDPKLIKEPEREKPPEDNARHSKTIYFLSAAFLLPILGLSAFLIISSSNKQLGTENSLQSGVTDPAIKKIVGDKNSVVKPESVQMAVTPQLPNQIASGNERNPDNKPLSTESLVKKVESSIAIVQGKYGSGSGFLIAGNIIATNKHVIDGEFTNQLHVIFPSDTDSIKKQYSASLIYEDPDLDIAFLELDSKRNKYLNLLKNYQLREGQDVIIIGNPGSRINDGRGILENVVAKGIMSTKTLIDSTLYYHVSIFANPGNSGGAIIDYSGNVLGTPTLKEIDKEGMLFCIPSDSILASYETAAQLSEDDRRIIHQKHEMNAAASIVDTMSELLLICMESYQKAMEDARKHGHDPQDGLDAIQDNIDDYLSELKNNGRIDTQGLLSLISDKQINDKQYNDCLKIMVNNIQKAELILRRPDASTFELSMSQFSKIHKELQKSLKERIDFIIADIEK